MSDRLSVTYDETSVGDEFATRLSMTSWHLLTGAALYGDTAAGHVDQEAAASSRYGRRIMHGYTVAGMMIGVVTARYNWALQGMLESQITFVAPIFEADNVDVRWRVVEMIPKEAFGGGLVDLEGRAWAGPEKRHALTMTIRVALGNYPGPTIGPPRTDG